MISRRAFQLGGLSLSATAMSHGAMPAFAQSAHAATNVNAIEAKAGKAQLLEAPEPMTDIWGYRGSVPGPLLTADQGKPFAADLINGLAQPTTIHWHGIRIDNAMDGVAYLTQEPTIPEQSFQYRFTPPDAGSYWYHPHNRTWEQMARGLYGMFIVREAKPPAVDQDLPMILDDWRLDNDGQISTRTFGAIHDKAHAGRLGNVLTLNGKPTDDIKVRAGERLRLRVLNAANARVMALQFEGHTPTIIALDGQPVQPFVPDGKVVLLAPSQRADVILDMTGETGTQARMMLLTQRQKIHTGNLVYDNSKRRRTNPLSDPIVLPPNPMPTDLDLNRAVTTDLVMSGGAMGAMRTARFQGQEYSLRELAQQYGKVWAFNGEAGMTSDPLAKYERGQTVKVRMFNETAWPHAMHFHGHHVREVSHSKRKPLPYWRDTVLMMPREETTVAFVAHNPGKWMCHCHMLEHQAGGMATWFEVS